MIRLYITRMPAALPLQEGRAASSQAAYALLSFAMQERGSDPAVLTLCRTSEGKPYFAGHEAEFSLSHSGEWVVCALSDAPVGVDVERIRSVSERLWGRFLAISPDEPYGGDWEAILRWTRYEAALKREGKKAPIDPDRCTTLDCIEGYLLTVCGDGEVSPVQWVEYERLLIP